MMMAFSDFISCLLTDTLVPTIYKVLVFRIKIDQHKVCDETTFSATNGESTGQVLQCSSKSDSQ